MPSKLERHAEQLGALGHPVRLRALRFVVQAGAEGASAGDIQAHVDLPASTLSHHLKRLVDAGVLASRTEGTYRYYSADYAALRPHRLPVGGLLQAGNRQGPTFAETSPNAAVHVHGTCCRTACASSVAHRIGSRSSPPRLRIEHNARHDTGRTR